MVGALTIFYFGRPPPFAVIPHTEWGMQVAGLAYGTEQPS